MNLSALFSILICQLSLTMIVGQRNGTYPFIVSISLAETATLCVRTNFANIFFRILYCKACRFNSKCRECEARDCDIDLECQHGLLCADAHKTELQAAGFDSRKAYCDITLGVRSWELCYDQIGRASCRERVLNLV